MFVRSALPDGSIGVVGVSRSSTDGRIVADDNGTITAAKANTFRCGVVKPDWSSITMPQDGTLENLFTVRGVSAGDMTSVSMVKDGDWWKGEYNYNLTYQEEYRPTFCYPRIWSGNTPSTRQTPDNSIICALVTYTTGTLGRILYSVISYNPFSGASTPDEFNNFVAGVHIPKVVSTSQVNTLTIKISIAYKSPSVFDYNTIIIRSYN
jgi:hypothetical protein